MHKPIITVVSGLPRSGTSMMMRMLESGGMTVLTDKERTADDDNPKGYFEFERVKKLKEDKAWLPEAVNKVVKIISFLMPEVLPDYHYKVIFINRHLDEVLASQRQMLLRRGEATDKVSDDRMRELYGKHLEQVRRWLKDQPNIDVLYIDHREVIERPRLVAEQVQTFLDDDLDVGLDVDKMTAAVDPTLHRQRA